MRLSLLLPQGAFTGMVMFLVLAGVDAAGLDENDQ